MNLVQLFGTVLLEGSVNQPESNIHSKACLKMQNIQKRV